MVNSSFVSFFFIMSKRFRNSSESKRTNFIKILFWELVKRIAIMSLSVNSSLRYDVISSIFSLSNNNVNVVVFSNKGSSSIFSCSCDIIILNYLFILF